MIETEIKAEVIALVSEFFLDKKYDNITINHIDLIDDGGMDSITFISIIIEIESKFNFVIPDEMLMMENFRNIDDISCLIYKIKAAF